MTAIAEEAMTAIVVKEDTKAAAATALMRTAPHHAATAAAWSAQYHSVTAMVHSEAAALQDLQALSEVQVMAQHPLAVVVPSLAEVHEAR